MASKTRSFVALLSCVSALLATGCATTVKHPPAKAYMDARKSFPPAPHPNMPREQSKVVLPTYLIEPPDILEITGLFLTPKQPYVLRPGDVVAVQATGVEEDIPLQGEFLVKPDGMIDLGPQYGRIQVAGMLAEHAQQRVQATLKSKYKNPVAWLSLAQAREVQPNRRAVFGRS